MSVIEYELREKDLIAFNDHQFSRSPNAQRTMRKYRYGIPAFLVASGLLFWIVYDEWYSALYVTALALLWILVIPKFVRWDIRRTALKQYSDKQKADLFGSYRLRAEPQALHEHAPVGRSKIPWDEVLRVELEKDYAFIFVDVNSALIIPKETITSGDLHEFVGKVDEYIEHAG